MLAFPLQAFFVALPDCAPVEGAVLVGGVLDPHKIDVGLDLVAFEVVHQTDGHARSHSGFEHELIGRFRNWFKVQVVKPHASDARHVPRHVHLRQVPCPKAHRLIRAVTHVPIREGGFHRHAAPGVEHHAHVVIFKGDVTVVAGHGSAKNAKATCELVV